MKEYELDSSGNSDRDILDDIAGVYTKVLDCNAEHLRMIGDENYYGYKILNGPPIANPAILFLGFQPGGCKDDQRRYKQYERAWPAELEYLNGDEVFFEKVRNLFPHDREFLRKCMGMNLIFFRAPNVLAWNKQIQRKSRMHLESFCTKHAKTMIDCINPRLIVVVGMATAKRIKKQNKDYLREDRDEPWCRGVKNRVLAKSAIALGRDAVVCLHLSGCQISIEDYNRLRVFIQRKAGYGSTRACET
jgi:hypothetical protein